jgi:hypothetical protein
MRDDDCGSPICQKKTEFFYYLVMFGIPSSMLKRFGKYCMSASYDCDDIAREELEKLEKLQKAD